MPKDMLKEIFASAQNFESALSEIYAQGKTDGGETLRDRFAMAALAGMMASPFDMDGGRETVTAHFATMSYSYADAMIKARDIRRDSGQSD